MKKKVFVTGGAGFIGSCTSELLKRSGYEPVIFDNLSNSGKPRDASIAFYQVDLADLQATREAWRAAGPAHAVIHFAAKALVSESCAEPEMYFRNNLLSTLNTAQLAVELSVPHYVHSSSCAIYGIPANVPIIEEEPVKPITPYGESKLIAEQMLSHMKKYRGLKILNLRYFNPAGALNDGAIGEAHEPETHLIPNVVRAFAAKRPVPVYGDDYPTPDGTCIRDFIHIEDLARAHLLAIEYLAGNKETVEALNIGGGTGTSVKQVIDAAADVFGTAPLTEIFPRRPGDPPALVANSAKAQRLLGWRPERGIREMIESHRKWEELRKGF